MWFAKLALFPFSARELVWKTRRGAVCRILSSRISRDNTSRCDKLAARNNFVKETKMREAHKLGRNTSFRSQRTKPMGNWNHSCLPLFVRNTNQNLDFFLQSHRIRWDWNVNIGLYFPIEIDGCKCLQKIALALNPLTSYPI